MIKNSRFLILIIFCVNTLLSLSQKQNYTKYVNPFIGTDGHGHTYPGAQLPFGFMQLSPDTRLDGWDGCSAYHYSDSIIYGFSHTHLSGTGCSDYGDILLMPATNIKTPEKYSFASLFSKQTEKASPGFYSVHLEKPNVLVELTATERCGMHKYRFPKKSEPLVFLDLKHRDEVLDSYVEIVSPTEIRGMRRSKAWANDQYVFFVIRFSVPFTKAEIFNNDKMSPSNHFAKSKNIKARFIFSSLSGKPLLLKIGISGVDTLGARLNLDKEMPDWNFSKIKKQAESKWNIELSKIQVEGGTNDQMTVFYSALYHAFLSPNVYNDVDGRYRGRDQKIYTANGWNYYTVFSLWDTYRALHPLLALIDPLRTLDFIKTILAQFEQSDLLPMWELSANETDCMIGYHSVSVIYDAWVKGIRGFDLEKAYQAMKKSAMQTRLGLNEMDKMGYIPSDMEHESVSKTLEYAYDDWCIAQVAKVLNKENEYQYFIQRAQAWKHIFDSNHGFMRPRFNGGWYTPFDPAEVNNNYTEANSWQYSFYVPHDIETFIQKMGGKEAFEAKLDALFQAKSSLTGREQVDITGLIGQYAHGNEPSHHIAYLYNFIGAPEKTQYYVRKIMNDFYSSKPDGLCGNEDCGQMSAWLVMSAMGFYPVTPGTTQYSLGSPWFKKIKINFSNGKVFSIEAPGNSNENIYIKSAMWNYSAYNSLILNHKDILDGGTLFLEMTSTKGSSFGKTDESSKFTKIIDNQILVSPIIEADSRTFKDSLKITISFERDENSAVYFTMDGSEPTVNSARYSLPIYISKSTVVKAQIINRLRQKSGITVAAYHKIDKDVKVTLKHPYNPQYHAGGSEGLVDGIRGTTNWRLGNWQGFQEADFEAVVDYGSVKIINEVGASFLQDVRSWIWMPKEVTFWFSLDGVNYNLIGSVPNSMKDDNYELKVSDFTCKLPTSAQVRYIKILAKNYGDIPEWHAGFGGKAFIFVDEVWVK